MADPALEALLEPEMEAARIRREIETPEKVIPFLECDLDRAEKRSGELLGFRTKFAKPIQHMALSGRPGRSRRQGGKAYRAILSRTISAG